MLAIVVAVGIGIGFGRSRPLATALALSAVFGLVACGAIAILIAQIVNAQIGADRGFATLILQARPSMLAGLVVAPFAAFITQYRRRNRGGS